MTTSGFDTTADNPPTQPSEFLPQTPPLTGKASSGSGLSYLHCLLKNLRQGVIIIDAGQTVLLWNDPIKEMTGIDAKQAIGMKASPQTIKLLDPNDNPISNDQCPFAKCINSKEEVCNNYRIIGRSGREIKAEIHAIPVFDGTRLQGAVVLVSDESIQFALKKQLRDLHAASTLDPLTQVANRAEFERTLKQYVSTHLETNIPCSLIVTDIDYFKSINDNYGHHIGDQALMAFAQLLKGFVRNLDMVSRFGGEEFVILCAKCDQKSAAERAEKIRLELTQTPQAALNGKCLTASFGVSQLIPGDTPADLFVRADQALLKAKELGRNRVVLASQGEDEIELCSEEKSPATGIVWRELQGRILSSNEYITTTPRSLLVQKIGGYIREANGEIVRVTPDYTTVKIEQADPNNPKRKGRFVVDIELHDVEREHRQGATKTILRITFRPQRSGMFAKNAEDTLEYAIQEIRRYLMLHDPTSRLEVDAAATESGRA